MRRSLRSVLLLPSMVVGLFVVATPAFAAPTAADPGAEAEQESLYADFEAAAKAYRDGVAQAAAGERRAGKRAAQRAMDRMFDLSARCERTEGCDGVRLMARFDALLGAGTRVAGEGSTGSDAEAAPDAGRTGTSLASSSDSPVITAFPNAAETLNQLNGRDLRELIVQNEAVRAAMAEWLTALRPQLINAHEQYQYMRFLMWPEYERAGLPEALLFAIMARESGGRVHAISPAGAAGLMQFMPATGRRFGLGWQDGYDTRFEPQLASRASTQYLNERFAELGHNLELALAAYNGGEGRIGRLARANPGKSFWDPAVYNALPKETRDYVPYILSAAWLFLHPEEYGLEFPSVNGAATVLALKQPASINQLTICLGNGESRYGYFRALRNLNPRWLPEAVLPAGTELRVPVAVMPLYDAGCVSGARAEQALALVSARKPEVDPAPAAVRVAASGGSRYTVRRGDTLSAIARRHGCNAQSVARANGLRSPYALRPGQRLSLSGCRG
ncbi:MAG: transglycosylase SLT domain-containing protein [Silanimonas sp.]